MRTKLLKQLRKESWNKYEVRKSDAVNDGDRPWRIWTGPKTSLAYYEYNTKEAVVKVCKRFWHEQAEKYLWINRDKRKCNKYPW